MDAMLVKYFGNEREYLVYDTAKFHAMMQPKAVRSICSRNFGLAVAGLMVGPVMNDGNPVMKVYAPDGNEQPMEEDAMAVCRCYLEDAGYVTSDGSRQAKAGLIGKIFLSEEFVQTYMMAS